MGSPATGTAGSPATGSRAPRRWLTLVVAGVAALSVVAATFWSGILFEQKGLRERATHYFDRVSLEAKAELGGSDAQLLTWQSVNANFYTLEYVNARLGPPMGGGGAITEIAGNIVHVSPLGRFDYMTRDYRLGPIDLLAPMGVELLRKSKYNDDSLFSWHHFRAYDLLAVQTSPERFDLYASFSRYVNEECFQFAVWRAKVTANAQGVKAVSPDWEEVFTARPGCLRPKDRGWRFLGLGAGGRLALLDNHTILVGVGDHQYDGFNDSWAAAQDPATDLGKIIAFDTATKKPRVYATGIRNPQGLVVMRDGRVFDTEHGPQAGDEINLIREGANYGWPLASYGMNYGYPRRVWPFTKTPGEHEGFEKPVFSFTPAIGPSNLAEIDPREFPLWNHDVVLGSLRGSTLFHLRIEGDRVRYVEPFYTEPGVRFRDVIVTSDGRIAALTNNGTLMLFRNAELHTKEPRTIAVTGLTSLTKPFPEEVPPDHLTPVERGKQVFEVACASCHSPGTDIGPGPPLGGIVGRRVGSVPGFGYSKALKNYDAVWTEELLTSFLTDPNAHFEGTIMPPPTFDWLEFPHVVEYLKTLK